MRRGAGAYGAAFSMEIRIDGAPHGGIGSMEAHDTFDRPRGGLTAAQVGATGVRHLPTPAPRLS